MSNWLYLIISWVAFMNASNNFSLMIGVIDHNYSYQGSWVKALFSIVIAVYFGWNLINNSVKR